MFSIKLSEQDNINHILFLSEEELRIIVDAMLNSQDWKLDNKIKNYEIAWKLHKLIEKA